jgi:endoglucanase
MFDGAGVHDGETIYAKLTTRDCSAEAVVLENAVIENDEAVMIVNIVLDMNIFCLYSIWEGFFPCYHLHKINGLAIISFYMGTLVRMPYLLLCIIISFGITGCKSMGNEQGKTENPMTRISVEGNRLVAGGKDFRLRGVSIADPYKLDIEDNHFSEDIFAELVNWNINVVRVPIHPGCWQAEKDFTTKYLDVIVEWAVKYRFYIILDWHAIGNPVTGQSQGAELIENKFPAYDSRMSLAEEAWMILAEKYGGLPFVIFEIFNEPARLDTNSSWRQWHTMITNLVKKIREKAPDTLVLVSGWHWSLDLTGFGRIPVELDNIAYVAHVYASHGDWDINFGFLGKKYPVVVTEWGFSPTVDENAVYYGHRDTFGQKFLRYMEENNFSWVCWCFHPRWLPNMITNWEYEPTEEGLLTKQVLSGRNASPGLTIVEPADRSIVSKTITIEGTMRDDIGVLCVDLKIGDADYRSAETAFNSTYTFGIWSFPVNTYMYKNGLLEIKSRVIDTSGQETVSGLTVILDNEINTEPPVVTISAPADQMTLGGTIEFEVEADDYNGLEEIKLIIDEDIIIYDKFTHSATFRCWDDSGILSLFDTNDPGTFSKAAVDNGQFSAMLNTNWLYDGEHRFIVRAKDIFGNTQEQSIIFIVDNSDVSRGCENLHEWIVYAGGGAEIERKLVPGISGNAIKIDYRGDASGWWGVTRKCLLDLSGYSGVEFYLKGTPENIIRLHFLDNGLVFWVYELSPEANWQKIRIPFSAVNYRTDYQYAGTPLVDKPDLKRLYEFQIIHSVQTQEAEGDFSLDEITFYK